MAAVTDYHKCNTETPVAKTTQVYYLMVLEVGNLNDSHRAKVEVLARLCCLAPALGEACFSSPLPASRRPHSAVQPSPLRAMTEVEIRVSSRDSDTTFSDASTYEEPCGQPG